MALRAGTTGLCGIPAGTVNACPRAELNGSRLSHRADDTAAGPGDQDAGQHLPCLGRPRLGYVEGPDADAGVDQQAELGDGEAGSGAHPGDEAEQGEVADAEQDAGAELHGVYLHLDAGVGGAVVEAGRAIRGTTGAAGEFGHMPFGDPARRCRCGARGCWNTSLDGRALARLLHQRVPADDVGYLRRVLASARVGQPGALSAIRAVASSIGRGVAGLVNGLDPHLVVVGGFGPELLHIAADEVTAAYHDGLMAFRAIPPPPIVPARLGSDAPLLGAADEAFALLLTDEGLQAWAARQL